MQCYLYAVNSTVLSSFLFARSRLDQGNSFVSSERVEDDDDDDNSTFGHISLTRARKVHSRGFIGGPLRGSPSYDVVKYNVRALVPLTSPSPKNSVVTIDSYRAANASSINPLAEASHTGCISGM